MLERLEAVLQPIMWRNDKISVGDELKLPPRTLDVSPLILQPSSQQTMTAVTQRAFDWVVNVGTLGFSRIVACRSGHLISTKFLGNS